jgi:2-polyprenyl-6-methoxyphenol hydroxylase-like FAD-dependent oxidoreductase
VSKNVAIIGAGPVGLAAAAHVLERGMTPIVLEAGPEASHSIRQWQHVQLFSPWEYNVDKAAARLLAPTGWNSPDPHALSDRHRTARAIFRPACNENAAERPHLDVEQGHRHQPPRL